MNLNYFIQNMISLLKKLFKIITSFKFLSSLICFIGLLYHTTQLLSEYWQGKTIVSIEIERKVNNTLPAITICYPYALSFEKISLLDQKYMKLYKLYLFHLNEFKINDSAGSFREMLKIYSEVKLNIIKRIQNNELVLNEMILNYSIDMDVSQSIRGKENRISQDIIGMPLESFHLEQNNAIGKCFTFFSSLQKRWQDYLTNFKYFTIIIKKNLTLVPFGNGLLLSVHSPNTLPELSIDDFKHVFFKKGYIITFSRLFTKLLSGGYDTDCFDYDLNYKHGNFNSRSDCIAWCYQDKLNDICKTNAIHHSSFLLRKQIFINKQFKSLDTCILADSSFVPRAYSFCHNVCRKDCEFNYFSINVEEVASANDKQDNIPLYFSHNNLPDIFIMYVPKIKFINLVCEFGGLLGMWVGYSLLVLMEDFNKIINVLMRKHNLFDVKNTIVVKNNYISLFTKILRKTNRRRQIHLK